MGFGKIPSEVRAAEEAAREAREVAENRPMSPFERKLIGVLEDIRDNIGHPLPAPLPGAALPEARVSVTRPDGTVQDFGPGVYLTTVDPDPLGPLLDSPPAVLTRSIQAGGRALSNSFPMFREDLTATGFEKFAEVAIEAALHEAASDRSAPEWRVGGPPDTSTVQQSSGDEPAGGEPPERPPAGPLT